jgi:AcrR family transcriptional regulator
VFARNGYQQPTLTDIARAAGVAPEAIYYHFGGKEALFVETLRAALHEFSAHILSVRPDTEAGTVQSLREVVGAGWYWWETHPDAARLVARYSEGSTVRAIELRRDWEERHLQRAYDYVPDVPTAVGRRRAREQHAAHSVAIRLVLNLILASQAAVIDGTLEGVDRATIATAVEDMCAALMLSVR